MPGVQGSGFYPIVKSDEEDLRKPGFLKNQTDAAITVKVTTQNGSVGNLVVGPYYTEPIVIARVWSTGSDSFGADDLVVVI